MYFNQYDENNRAEADYEQQQQQQKEKNNNNGQQAKIYLCA